MEQNQKKRTAGWYLDKSVLFLVRAVVGGVFLAFGIAKAIEPREEMYMAVNNYQLIPFEWIPPLANILIGMEILVGLFLLLGLFNYWTTLVAGGLLIMFILFILQALARGLDLPDCGCSGSLIQLGESPQQVLWRDIAMLIGLAWYFIRRNAVPWTMDSLLQKQ